MIYQKLAEFDKEIYDLIKKEEKRQKHGLELIASENFAPIAVLEANSSVLCNKYSEGQVNCRYYGGNEYIDQIESLCKKRALELFSLDPNIWDVNVQCLSGSDANFSVYLGLVGKDGKIMGLDLPSGGHLTHGYQTNKRKISASSIFFNSIAYRCKSKDFLDCEIDYEDLKKRAEEFKPDLIICGASAYSLDFDYKELRKIAGEKYLMCDMAHISGFIATKEMKNAFDYCDVVTTTSHKILRGPRAGIIFYKKEKVIKSEKIDVKAKIDFAVFPQLHGGPHNQKIGALAVCLKMANTEEYKNYIKQVKKNAQVMFNELKRLDYKIINNKTVCHLILIKLEGVSGSTVEKVCEMCGISINKNCIPTDKSPLNPTGIRLGSQALTTRGMKEEDFRKVVKFLHRAIEISKSLKKNEIKENEEIKKLKEEVYNFSDKFPLPIKEF